ADFDVPGLSADDARTRALRVDDFEDAAAGDDDVVVLLHDPDGVPVGLRLSDREHAGRGAAGHAAHPAALLPRDRPRHLPEGRGLETLVAAALAPCGWGPGN